MREIQIQASLIQLGLRNRHVSLGRQELILGLLKGFGRNRTRRVLLKPCIAPRPVTGGLRNSLLLAHVGFGLRKRHAGWPVVQIKKRIAHFHKLIVADMHGLDLPGHAGGDLNDFRLHHPVTRPRIPEIGVVTDVAENAGNHDDQQRQEPAKQTVDAHRTIPNGRRRHT